MPRDFTNPAQPRTRVVAGFRPIGATVRPLADRMAATAIEALAQRGDHAKAAQFGGMFDEHRRQRDGEDAA